MDAESELLPADGPFTRSQSSCLLEEEVGGTPSNWSSSQQQKPEVRSLSTSGQTETAPTAAAVVHSRADPWRWDHEDLARHQLFHQAEWTEDSMSEWRRWRLPLN